MSAARSARRLLVATLATSAFGVFASPVLAGTRRPVPDVVDLPLPIATAELQAAGFRAKPVAAPAGTSAEPAGTVARQEPGGFWWAETGIEIVLYVRGGTGAPSPGGPAATAPKTADPGVPYGPARPVDPVPAPTAAMLVPDVVGKTESEALESLRSWRVTIAPVDAVAGSEGRVVSQSPAAGAALAANGVVTLSIGSAGAPPPGAARVPSVIGLELEAALAQLKAVRLLPMPNFVASDAAGDGKVVSQEPSAGVIVARDSNVLVNVGKSPRTALLEAEVPDVRRLSELDARSRLAAAGLKALVRDRLADPANTNLVLEQTPAAGARAPRDSAVQIVVGRVLLLPVAVPDVMGRDAAEAEHLLEDAGFAVERATALSLPGSAGRVIAQEPVATQSAIRGSVVRVTVGQPSPSSAAAAVPDIAGLSEMDAVARLQTAGYRVSKQVVPGTAAEVGQLRGTQPPAGSALARGGDVVLLVVQADAPTRTFALPNYVGMEASNAQALLTSAGLASTITYVQSVPEGRVVSQTPNAGTPVSAGASVTLMVSRAPTLAQTVLIGPPTGTSTPKSSGVLFQWMPVQEAEDYQFEIFKEKDGTWVIADNDITRGTQKRPSRVHTGWYQWHVRARRANGTITGAWSEWRRLTIY